MPARKHPKLIGAPYRRPGLRRGDRVEDLLRGRLWVVGRSEAPIPWPLVMTPGGGHSPVPAMTDELRRAVETESVAAVAHHWGVHPNTVMAWRRALGVARDNPGTQSLRRRPARPDSKRRGPAPGTTPRATLDDARRAELTRRARSGESPIALAIEYGVSRQYVTRLRKRLMTEPN